MQSEILKKIDDDWEMFNNFPPEVREALLALSDETLWWDGEATPHQYEVNLTYALEHWKKVQKRYNLEHIDYRDFC